MTRTVRRYAMAAVFAGALALPMGVATIATPAPSRAACEPGQVDRGSGCVPACKDSTYMDTQSGECLDLASAIATELPGGSGFSLPSLPAPSEIPPLVSAPVEVGLPGVGLPGIGIGLDLWPNLPPIGGPGVGAPPGVGVPEIGVPEIGVPEIGVPQIGPPQLPKRKPICGPGIETPIPMVGFTPCI